MKLCNADVHVCSQADLWLCSVVLLQYCATGHTMLSHYTNEIYITKHTVPVGVV